MARVLVFVPSYNDHHTVSEVIKHVVDLGEEFRILIVDDGSEEAFDPAVRASVLHFRMPDNFGLGACTHVAFDHAIAHGYNAVVRIDGDGQHSTDDIPRVLAPLLEENADLVVGGRANPQSGMSVWPRRLTKGYYTWVAKLVTRGRAPRDVNTGFFAANRKAITTLNRFGLERFPEPQMFVLACRENLRVTEVSIEQKPRRMGRTTLGVMHALRMLYRFNVFVMGELLRRPNS